MDIKKISENFVLYGNYHSAKAFGNGNINQTFLVTYNQAGILTRYIIRKINKNVFKQPLTVINNSVNISLHIKDKLELQDDKNIGMKAMTFIKNHNGNYYFMDKNEDFWCTVLFFEGAYTVDYVQNAEQAYKSAYAFGNFQKNVIDANISNYKETIPDFHNLSARIIVYGEAVKTDIVGRFKNILQEHNQLEENMNISEEFTHLKNRKSLPIRITHNDTKINNVMLDKATNEGLCVIDLDTVMPGTVLNDFGDMVRTSTSPVAEDDKDIEKVKLQIDIFEALVKGYLKPLNGILSKVELSNLVFGAKLIVYEQAVRFITDYIANDVYYTTSYENHNLIRAKNQFALLNSILKQEVEMKNIIKKYI